MKRSVIGKRLRMRIAILVILAFTCTAYASAAGKTTGKVVNCDYLNFRSGKGTSKGVVKVLKNGDKLDILAKENGWYKVSVGDKVGWVCSSYVSTSSSTSAQSASSSSTKTGYVSATALNCRVGASVAFRIVEVLDPGEKVTILGSASGWYNVKTASGKSGWVCASYISSTPVSVSNKTVTVSSNGSVKTSSSSGGSKLSKVVDLAKYVKSLGVPYVWGGTTLRGFDCSGLVQYVYKNAGVTLPRVASAQASVGSYVSKNNLKPGDLVFFGSGSSITHVGLCVGGDRMIHAPTSGQNVSEASLSSSYYQTNYVTARRIVK